MIHQLFQSHRFPTASLSRSEEKLIDKRGDGACIVTSGRVSGRGGWEKGGGGGAGGGDLRDFHKSTHLKYSV